MSGKRKERKRQAAAQQQSSKNYAEAKGELAKGQKMGREKFSELSGMQFSEVGDMMQTAIGNATDNLDRYSGASDQIRQQGNQQAFADRLRSGSMGGQSAAQQSQIANNASLGAANQRYGEQEKAEQTYRQMASTLRNNAATMEQGFGTQQLATVKELSIADRPSGSRK